MKTLRQNTSSKIWLGRWLSSANFAMFLVSIISIFVLASGKSSSSSLSSSSHFFYWIIVNIFSILNAHMKSFFELELETCYFLYVEKEGKKERKRKRDRERGRYRKSWLFFLYFILVFFRHLRMLPLVAAAVHFAVQFKLRMGVR